MKIDIASILGSKLKKISGKPLKAALKSSPFQEMIVKKIQQHSGRLFFAHPARPQALQKGQVFKDRNPGIYIEALRKGLLSKGKLTDQVYIKREDIHLLGDLLERCGVNQKPAGQYLDRLLENSGNGEIQLSRFFTIVKEIDSQIENQSSEVILDSSAVPYLVSVLRDYNLSDNEIIKVSNAGRKEEGGVDLHKLIEKLEDVYNASTRDFSGIVDLEKNTSITKKLKSIGIEVPSIKKTGFLHMEDLITSLKQMAHIFNDVTDAPAGSEPLYIAAEDLKRLNIKMPQTGGREASPVKAEVIPGTGTEIPSDIKEAINRIIENTVDSKEKNETLTSVLAGSKVKFDDPVSKQLKIDKTASGQQEPETIKKAEHQTATGNEDQRASVPRLQESIKSAAGASVEPASVEGPDSKPVPGQSDFKPAGIILEPSFENRAENTAGVELKNHSPGNSVALPNYLVDQVGKQITRAITRGDGIIRFQMKPSELGFVKLEIQMADNQISLSVTAENSTVRELMLANIRELKESLVGQGFKLGLLDIQISNDSNPFFSNSQEHFERGQNPGYEKQDQPAFFVTDEMEDSFINNNRKLRSGSTIELVA